MTLSETIAYLAMLVGHHLFSFSTESELSDFARAAVACSIIGFVIAVAVMFPSDDREHFTGKQLTVHLLKILLVIVIAIIAAPALGIILVSVGVFLWNCITGFLNWVYSFLVVAVESLR